MEHQLAAVQEAEPLKRHVAHTGIPPVFESPSPSIPSHYPGNMAVQRLALDGCADSAAGMPAPRIVHDALRSPGQPLAPSTRSRMEKHLGHDLSDVRVHTDGRAAESAQAVQASAYTVGRDIVFGAGQYSPETETGRHLLAHELTHVVQQSNQPVDIENLRVGAANDASEKEARQSAMSDGERASGASISPATEARVQRFGFGDVLDIVAPGTGQAWEHSSTSEKFAAGAIGVVSAFAPGAAPAVAAWISNPRNQQFLSDLKASVEESPRHVMEFLQGEVWAAIKEHWVRIMAVTIGLLVAEAIIGSLTAAPEPTLLTKVIAVILQIIVIAVLAYFAKVEVVGAYEEGIQWYSIAAQANGSPALISDASRAFVRMVWHILMAVLALAGLRARIGGFRVPTGTVATGEGIEGGVEQGSNVVDISSHPRYVPHFQESGGPVASGGAGPYFGGSAAPKLDPFVQTEPPPPVVSQGAGTVAGKAPVTGPGIQPVPAIAAGVSAATEEGQERKCGDPDLPWTSFSLAGTDRGEHMMAEPLTRCGPPGSGPSIRLPAWACIQAAPGSETNYWVHAHLLHGLGGGKMDLHGPGYDPRNLILTDKSLNLNMFRNVEGAAISLTHIHDQTLSYEVTPRHMADSGDRRYFADGMRILLKQIDPRTRQMLALLYDGTITSNHQRTVPSNCT